MKPHHAIRRETDAALAHTEVDLVGRPMWKHVIAGLLLILCTLGLIGKACGLAIGVWKL